MHPRMTTPAGALPTLARRFNPASWWLCAGLLALPLLAAAQPLPRPAETLPDFSPDGAWCWFSDPRAVERAGVTYSGWVTTDGSIEVGALDHATGRVTSAVLHPEFERDDHDHPALLILPDGRIAAFYSLHTKGDLRLRVTTRPGDISAWTPERELGLAMPERGRWGTTYANPVLLSQENNRVYLCWRGSDWKPNIAYSDDAGSTWSTPQPLVARPGADQMNRPYLKLRSDGIGRIDFVFTDGHPRNEPGNSVYYMRYDNGQFRRADGTPLGGWEDLPIDPARCDRVYDGRTAGRAWIWDIAISAEGDPAIAFNRFPSETDHHYNHARWSNGQWHVTAITPAGRWFPETPEGATEREPNYSGGMALDPADPAVVYTSRPVNGVFEIERWTWSPTDAGWRGTAVTAGSRWNNLRPVVVRAGAPGASRVLWMNTQRYVHYTDYRAAIKIVDWP
jgi:hypothetical protein